jgi:hypothetical protein
MSLTVKSFLLFLFLFISKFYLFAEKVPVSIIKKVAINFMNEKTKRAFSKNDIINLSCIINKNDTLFYIIEFSPEGFIILSADDICFPVLAFSSEGKYISNYPPAFSEMLKCRMKEIKESKKIISTSNIEIKNLWLRYSVDENLFSKKGSIKTIGPLLNTTWSQNYPYNKFCPPTNTLGSGGRTYAGCVAVALAQLIKYYNWPINGKGYYEYDHFIYGKISANFGSTTYDWGNMISTINENSAEINIDAIAKLIFHCGVSVSMNYSPVNSYAETTDVKSALINFFRYSEESKIIMKKLDNQIVYSDSQWVELIKSELLNMRPLIYRGNNSEGYQGHAFVVDGFNDGYFHINWGWGGNFNGYFLLTALTPTNTFDFSYDNIAIINIKPEKSMKNTFSTKLPDNFYLYQNFPNPFNSQTTISFEIKEPTNVKLKIYSLLGEEVMTLINSYLQPKEYRISFDAKNLPSGVYFYSLETDNFFDIKRFLLLK